MHVQLQMLVAMQTWVLYGMTLCAQMSAKNAQWMSAALLTPCLQETCEKTCSQKGN